MAIGPHIPAAAQSSGRRFAVRVGLFYASTLGIIGVSLPFFPVWLKAIGIDAFWIGVINAVPALTRFTVLPFITAFAERRQALRSAMIMLAFLTAAGFALVGLLQYPLAILIVFIPIACVWTPLAPLTDGYTLKGLADHRIYGLLRLWGSAAFVVTALGCGWLADRIAAPYLIWAIVAVAAVSAGVSLGLLPLPPSRATSSTPIRANTLLRQPLFLAIIASAALVQGSHSAYYGFASITWQNAGLGGLPIAILWSLGVLAEIAVFALSPRFRCSPALLVLIGSAGAMLRWLITAQEPPLGALAVVQLMHGMSFAMTHLGTVGLMVRCVPHHVLASAQGYLVAAIGIATSAAMILCGAIYEQIGQGIYYVMAALALAGLLTVMAARPGLDKAGVVAA